MERPEWYPAVGVVTSRTPSGPISAVAAFQRRRDQVMSHRQLAPLPAALQPVSHGHGLEIPMALWGAISATGMSSGSIALIPMGARCVFNANPNPQVPGYATTRTAAGTATRETDEEPTLLLCGVYQLDAGLLMGAPTVGPRWTAI